MSLEDELLELNAVYQSVQEKNESLRLENEGLRALLADYVALVEELPPHSIIEWYERRTELLERYNALVKGGKP